jgi:hypothetical protein
MKIALPLLLLLAGCAHPQPVNPSPHPTAWFVVDSQVWYCDGNAPPTAPLCRRFGAPTAGDVLVH